MPSENRSIVRSYTKPRRPPPSVLRYVRYKMDDPVNAPKYCKYEDPRVCRAEFSGIDFHDEKEYLTSLHITQKQFRLLHPGMIRIFYY
jgi:hypothetical protein